MFASSVAHLLLPRHNSLNNFFIYLIFLFIAFHIEIPMYTFCAIALYLLLYKNKYHKKISSFFLTKYLFSTATLKHM